MENKITFEEFKNKVDKCENLITRSYVPFLEKDDIISNLTSILFCKVDVDTKEISEFNMYQEPDYLYEEMFTKVAIANAYFNVDIKDKVEFYDYMIENNLYDDLIDRVKDADKFETIMLNRIADKREFIKENYLHNNDEVSKLVADLLKENIENVKLQKKATHEIIEMNKMANSKDFNKIIKVIDTLNKNMKNPVYQKELANKLVDVSKEVNEEE